MVEAEPRKIINELRIHSLSDKSDAIHLHLNICALNSGNNDKLEHSRIKFDALVSGSFETCISI